MRLRAFFEAMLGVNPTTGDAPPLGGEAWVGTGPAVSPPAWEQDYPLAAYSLRNHAGTRGTAEEDAVLAMLDDCPWRGMWERMGRMPNPWPLDCRRRLVQHAEVVICEEGNPVLFQQGEHGRELSAPTDRDRYYIVLSGEVKFWLRFWYNRYLDIILTLYTL